MHTLHIISMGKALSACIAGCGIRRTRASFGLFCISSTARCSSPFMLRHFVCYLNEAAFDSCSSTYRAEPKAAVRQVLVQAVCMEPPYTAIA